MLNDNKILLSDTNIGLAEINQLDQSLQEHFSDRLTVQPVLTRSLVSFQANKNRPVYRWYKYKEAFSASLVEYFLEKYKILESEFTPGDFDDLKKGQSQKFGKNSRKSRVS
ncbi:MAG: hypothetical protein HPY59_03705 [Anaerolineae bacterium]|nr:hypothetical protein [Anaerolineae bacterium]